MADWKYIMVQVGDQSIPILFPNDITHSFMAGAMQMVFDTFDPSKDLRPRQLDALLDRGNYKPVSAGFISGLACSGTFGCSESLNGLNSREDDARVINCYPYEGGRDSTMPNVEPLVLLATIELLMKRIKE